jgi:cytochrome P450
MSALAFDLKDPEFFADPYPVYARLRAEDPVHQSPRGFRVLTRYEDIATVLRDSIFACAKTMTENGLYVAYAPGCEHYRDCSPGARVFVNTDDVDALHRELSERPNPNMRPGVEVVPWNAKVMDVIDPFGNRLSFNQPLEKS